MNTGNGIKHNFLFNLANTTLKVAYPLILFPYVSRILMPEGIGRFNYAEALTSYFILLASLGIPVYGLREISKRRDNIKALFSCLSEIFIINLCLAVISFGILFALLVTHVLEKEAQLILINASLILFTAFDFEWYYQAMERYKYITVRNISIKLIALALIILFVKDKQDLSIYAMLIVFSSAGSSALNFIGIVKDFSISQKSIYYKGVLREAINRHLKSILITSSMAIAGSVYLNLDLVMLGQLSTEVEVGFYAASVKIYRVLVTLVLSLSAVLIPRASYYYGIGEIEKFKSLIKLSFEFICIISIPCIFGTWLLSDQIIVVFGGNAFQPAYHILRIVIFLVFIVSMNNLMGMQILYPSNRETVFLKVIAFAALINATMNYLLIPKMNAQGAALSSVIAEGLIFSFFLWFTYRYFERQLLYKIVKYILAACLMSVIILLLKYRIEFGLYGNIIVLVTAGVFVYLGALYLFKETYFIQMIGKSIKK